MELRPIIEKVPESNEFVHPHPILNRVFQNRGASSPEDINYNIKNILHPFQMKGVSEAADLLIKHILNESKIVVIGDYDCDGATSTTIAVQGLTMHGAEAVEYQVPDRLTQGYGLSPEVVADIAHLKPDLIVTVDNGIASMDGVKAAKDLGCDVLVTDHHLTADGGVLPCADVIVNPEQPGCPFPSKNIAGCGVIFYVIAGLRAKMREQGVFDILGIKKPPNLALLLDVLAIGTVADVVSLDFNNRNLVACGIKRVREGSARPLIYHLLHLAGKDYRKFTSTDIGFVLGPMINAAGRLETMDLAIQGLLTNNEHESWRIAQQLYAINAQRKEMSATHEHEANEIMESEKIDADCSGVCIYNPDWHEGVVGILAGRIKEKLNRPSIALTMTHETANVIEAARAIRSGNHQDAEHRLVESKEKLKTVIVRALFRDGVTESLDIKAISDDQYAGHSETYASLNNLLDMVRNGVDYQDFEQAANAHVHSFGEIKGSCRSVPGVHLKHVLDHINKKHPEVLGKFGGHAMAAGVTINLSQFENFRKVFDQEVAKDLTDEIKAAKLEVDLADLSEDEISLDNAEMIQNAGPWGQHFREPIFSGKFEVVSTKPLQGKHLKMVVRVPGGKKLFDAISFNCIDGDFVPAKKGHIVDIVYKMEVNEFRNERKVQLLVDHVQDPKLIHELKEAQAFQDDENTTGSLDGVLDSQKKNNDRFRQSKLSNDTAPTI